MALIVFIFGLMIGSFLNVVTFRLHQKQSFIKGRSRCPKCHQQIRWFDNIPLLSFIMLSGRCRYCHTKISWQYPIVELVVGCLFAMAFWINFKLPIFNLSFIWDWSLLMPVVVKFLRDIFFISVLTVIFIYDFRWYLILDIITIPAIIVAFVFNIILGFNVLNLLLATGIGGGFFLIQFIISKGRWIGGGDIRLGFLMGSILGLPQVLVALFTAYISGLIIVVGLLMTGKKRMSSQVPFGTFLSIATIISLLWGTDILYYYLNFLTLS